MLWVLIPTALAGTLSGTITADDTGDGIEDVLVAAFDLRLDYDYVASSSDGSYILEDLPAGEYRVWAIPEGTVNRVPAFYPSGLTYCEGERVVIPADGEVSGVDFSLSEGGTITGRVVDSGGDPVPDVVVTAERTGDDLAGMSRAVRAEDDGSFTLAGLDLADGDGTDWICELDVDGWPLQFIGGAYDDDDADLVGVTIDGVTGLGDVALLDGILVTGTVTGPGGVPVEGASVHVYASSQVVSVETAADGTYEALGLPPGEALPWASADLLAQTYYPDADRPGSYLPAAEEGEVVEGADLSLPFGATLEVALDGDGDLSGVTGLLYNDEGSVGFGDRADEDGLLSFSGLYGGDYRLYVFAAEEGYQDDYIRDADGEPAWFSIDDGDTPGPVSVALSPRASLSGTVEDEDGAPVYGAYVIAWPEDDLLGAAAAVTDRDGVWTLHGLDEGRWTLEARYAPYCLSDPGYVSVYWLDEINEDRAAPMSLVAGELREDIAFSMPHDDDHDLMGDTWEDAYGLDVGRDDSAEDPDEDGYTNLEEYLLGTDPTESAAAPLGCGCGEGSKAALWLVLPALMGLRRRGRQG